MAQRPPRVPHSGRAGQGPTPPNDDAARAVGTDGAEAEPATEALPVIGAAAAAADRRAKAAKAAPAAPNKATAEGEPGERGEPAPSGTAKPQRRGLAAARDAARTAAQRGAGAVGQGVRKAKDAVAEEIEADLNGEHLPGGVRRRRRHDPADRERRLIERTALEGAIRDPGHAPRPRPSAPRATTPVPARALSTRVLALALILIVSGFMLFPAVTTYVRQNAELRSAQALLAQEKQTKENLQAELDRWDDPEFVRQQARERIQRFLPGEKRYVVIGVPEESATEEDTTLTPGEYRQGLPWGDGLIDSVVRTSTP
ncbi:FtsB family cell division protein [Galactobacter valiniphilus]|uniref:FtsB family cell division protein n=1 Tax=Galactobacter valiniphilus TaxID=2676122 RepID=UPI0037360741